MAAMLNDLFIREARIVRDRVPEEEAFPFTLPFARDFQKITFGAPVTFFVGENGSGKSTLLEALAVAWGFNPEGGSINFSFATRESHPESLANALRLVRGVRRPKTGYFLRAESYFNVATEIEKLDAAPGGGARIIDSYGGVSLHEQSHGESFFALFTHRFNDYGLYLLDEPEAALSFQRQLSFLARMHDLVNSGSQFLLATHSPILMAYPGAEIWEMSGEGMRMVEYEDLEQVRLYRYFLNNREGMLKELGLIARPVQGVLGLED